MVAKHGNARRGQRTRAYEIWAGIRKRCKSHPRYAGRGITICARWDRFENFLADMGEPPAKHSIERIDNAGNYEPSNCRWASPAEQNRNRRSNRDLTFRGKTQCATDWARELGINPLTILWRVRQGWTVERTLTEGVSAFDRPDAQTITAHGITLSVSAWAARHGWSRNTIYSRLHQGWTPEKAVTTPLRPRQRAGT